MKKISKNKGGFSLIELLVAVGIIVIMTTLTLSSMVAMREKKTLESAAREVAATVREAQNYALTGKGLKDQTVCVFTFSWVSGSSRYFMEGCKDQEYALKNGVTFGSPSGSIDFEVPFSMLSGPTKTITVKKGDSAYSYNVCVYSSGIVKETTDPCL